MLLLQFQQPFFFLYPAGIADQLALCPNHPMTGNQNSDRILMIRHPHCPCRLRSADCSGNLSIGSGLSVWNLLQCCPYLFLKSRPLAVQRQIKGLPLSPKKGTQLLSASLQQRCFFPHCIRRRLFPCHSDDAPLCFSDTQPSHRCLLQKAIFFHAQSSFRRLLNREISLAYPSASLGVSR